MNLDSADLPKARYAIIKADGRQLKVREGDVVRVHRIAGSPDGEVVFGEVLLAAGDDVVIGEAARRWSVRGRILRQTKARKIAVFHYKAKKRIRKRYGHRQPVTEVRIESIRSS